MKTGTTIPISEARKNIFLIAEEVQKDDIYFTLTERANSDDSGGRKATDLNKATDLQLEIYIRLKR